MADNNATEAVNGSSSHPYRMVAIRPRKACKRCGSRIEKGQVVERIESPNGKGHSWVHSACQTPVVVAAGGGDLAAAKLSALSVANREIAALEKALADAKQNATPNPAPAKVPHAKVVGCLHPAYDEIIELVAKRKPVFLPGPSGCGKSHLAMQVAEALGLSFSAISCSAGMSESQLLGRMVPHGAQGQFEFLSTPFLDAYENGGVFLFDEIDAADANVLLVINSALANGHLSVPSRHGNPVAQKHPDFVCIAAANTFGNGADREYVGRNQLDAATLDRFKIGTVPMDYDHKLETKLCPDKDLRTTMWRYRKAIASNRLKRTVSTRFLIDAHDMGWSIDRVSAKLFAGWRGDEVAKVVNATV